MTVLNADEPGPVDTVEDPTGADVRVERWEAVVPCVRRELHTVTVEMQTLHQNLAVTCRCRHGDDQNDLDALAVAFGDPVPRLCIDTAEIVDQMWSNDTDVSNRLRLYWAGLDTVIVLAAWAARDPTAPTTADFAAVLKAVTATRTSGTRLWSHQPVMRGFGTKVHAASLWPTHGRWWQPDDTDDADGWLDAFDGRITTWGRQWWETQGFDPYTAYDVWQTLTSVRPDR